MSTIFYLTVQFIETLGENNSKMTTFLGQMYTKFNVLMPTRSATILKKVAKYLIEAFDKRNFHVYLHYICYKFKA